MLVRREKRRKGLFVGNQNESNTGNWIDSRKQRKMSDEKERKKQGKEHKEKKSVTR